MSVNGWTVEMSLYIQHTCS